MRTLLPLIGLILLISCKEVTFKEPQPKDKKPLPSVPKNLQGKYLVMTEEGTPSKDTVVITSRGYRFGYFDPEERAVKNDEYEEGVLGDSMVLKSFKGYFFLSLNEDPEWILRVLKQEKNGDVLYMTLEDKTMEFNDYLEKLSAEIRIDSMTTEKETLYQIDPDPNQLVDLIKKGYFSEARLIKVPLSKNAARKLQ
ncbi:MAG TPA: hypothetical protein VGD40_15195 [Chryseosolibacter sp.]